MYIYRKTSPLNDNIEQKGRYHMGVVEDFIKEVSSTYRLTRKSSFKKRRHSRFEAVKILEEDRDYKVMMNDRLKKDHIALENKYQMEKLIMDHQHHPKDANGFYFHIKLQL